MNWSALASYFNKKLPTAKLSDNPGPDFNFDQIITCTVYTPGRQRQLKMYQDDRKLRFDRPMCDYVTIYQLFVLRRMKIK